MSSSSRSGMILRDSSHCCRHSTRCLFSPNRELCLPNIGTRHISRRSWKKMPEIDRRKLARLAWEQQKRDSLRTALIRQYEEEERPKWVRNSVRLGQSFRMDNDIRGEPRVSLRSQEEQSAQYNREEDVQCGIFWDIENVRNECAPSTPFHSMVCSNLVGHILQQLLPKRSEISPAVPSPPSFKPTSPTKPPSLNPASTQSTPSSA